MKYMFTLGCATLLHATIVATPSNAASSESSIAAPSAGEPRQKTAAEQPNCASFMPSGVLPELGNSLPLISVQIAPNGEMHNATIVRSSGDAATDKAIVACAEGRHFKPITSNNKPVSLTWTLMYQTAPQAGRDGFLPALVGGPPKSCAAYYPPRALRKHAEGDTLLTYIIGADGGTKDIKVQHSSGDADLDQTTWDCVAGWKFYPALQNGQPTEIDWATGIKWRLD